MSSQRGIALILALLITSFLSAVGLGLAVMVFMDRLATGNARGSVALLHAADAGIELAAHDLSRADWSAVLAGSDQASFSDGTPAGVRAIPAGGAVNLTAETNEINCGQTTTCTPTQMAANSYERPWGVNNPLWRLYAYGPLENITEVARPAPCYLACGLPTTSTSRMAIPSGMARNTGAACSACARWRSGPSGRAGPSRPSWPGCVSVQAVKKCASPAFVCKRGGKCDGWFLDPARRESYDRGRGKSADRPIM